MGANFYGSRLGWRRSGTRFGRLIAPEGVPAVDWISNADPEGITPRPGLIAESKRDIYDTEDLLRAWYERNGHVNSGQVPAFEFKVLESR